MKYLKIFEGENKRSSREILPDLADLSNNSRLTQELADSLADKLDDKEWRTLKEWLRLAKSQTNIKISQAKRKF